ncbi:nicotinate-nucleotide adenylyltransferase [Candidatus Endowatersipora endosymbiont of Watersipora subatra]|uniref:nicotinate-nucleotide adenylyltransferase n=1 Tax=Candidatus Endowatersipora endosymbiont of Watersipora subatra TaxID=3077946 RepID=UPI00312C8452
MRMPMVSPSQRVGLFGGSFNPPHEGHLHVARQGLRRLKLDQVWWIVTPGNPLKDRIKLAPLWERLDACLALVHDPAMKITAFETMLSIHYTAETLRTTKKRYPNVHFVWIMGADNLTLFHRWERWRDIIYMIPIAIVDRPGSSLSLHSTQAISVLSKDRLKESESTILAQKKPPAWTLLYGPRKILSSTSLRKDES